MILNLRNLEKFLAAIIFLLLVIIPLAVMNQHFLLLVDEYDRSATESTRNRLIEEMKEFRTDLVPRSFLHKIIKKVEKKVGLVSDTQNKPVFSIDSDPEIFGLRSAAEMRSVFRQLGGIDPAMIVTFGADATRLSYQFGSHFSAFSDSEKEQFAAVAAILTGELDKHHPVFEQNRQYLKDFVLKAVGQMGSFHEMKMDFLRSVISDAAYMPRNGESVFEMPTDKFNSHQAFCYLRALKSDEKVFGGYFVLFFSCDVNPQMLLKNAIVKSDNGPVRFFNDLHSGKFEENDSRLIYKSPTPVELIAYNRLFGSPVKIPDRIGVLFDTNSHRNTIDQYKAIPGFVFKLLLLLAFLSAAYYLFFGFPWQIRLRSSMFLGICTVVLLPYLFLGFFSGVFLHNYDQFSIYGLKSEAENFMFSLENYFFDQRLQNTLKTLQSKERLVRIAGLPEAELLKISSNYILGKGSKGDLSFFRFDGISRMFKFNEKKRTSIMRTDSFLGVKFLDNLRVLDRTKKSVIDLLNYSSMAEGFLSNLKEKYSDHRSLVNEGFECKDLARIDDYSRMIYYLIPDISQPSKPVIGICFSPVNNLIFVIYNPREFDLRVFSKDSDYSRFRFAMGQRRIEDYLLRWWPESLNPDSHLRDLMEEAITTRASGSRLRFRESGEAEFSLRSFLPKEQMVFAGISTRSADPMLKTLVKFYPFLVAGFAMACVLLFTNILARLFVDPVSGFIKAVKMVEKGNYLTRIKMAESDEFSLLAESFNSMVEGLAQREKMRRFMSEDLYEKLGDTSGLNEMRRASFSRVTILASDIRGFTTISEKNDPREIVALLNDYFTEMESAITGFGGVIGRFVGDAVVAVFYSDENELGEIKAVKAAINMRQRLESFNQRREKEGKFCINNGVGIASGIAASGMAGSEKGRMVFSVIGKVVQLAESLESSTRFFPSGILICPSTAELAKTRFRLEQASEKAGAVSYTVLSEKVSHD